MKAANIKTENKTLDQIVDEVVRAYMDCTELDPKTKVEIEIHTHRK